MRLLLLKKFNFTLLPRRTKLVLLFFAISLLCHIIIADLFFEYGFKTRMAKFMQAVKKQLSPAEQELLAKRAQQRRQAVQKAFKALHIAKPKKQAKLVAARGAFGWTLFENSPSTDKADTHETVIPTTMDGDVAASTSANATEEEPSTGQPPPAIIPQIETCTTVLIEKEETKAQSAESEKTAAQATDIKQQENSTASSTAIAAEELEVGQDEQIETTIAKSIPELGSAQPCTKPQPKLAKKAVASLLSGSRQERIEQIDKLTQALANGDPFSFVCKKTVVKKNALAPTAGSGPRRSTVRGAPRETGLSGPRSLIALTKGFVEKLDGEDGTDLIDQDGQEGITPDYSQLKYMMYESKVNWCLQAAWKQNFERHNGLLPLSGIFNAFFVFTMDKKGYVIASELLQSSGKKELDEMIMKTIKLASPFPPLPSYFDSDKYETGRRLIVTCNRSHF